MADPQEGVAADGTIATGVDRSRVPAPFEPLLADAVALAGECGASLYVYGSVANGTVRPGLSDVDLLSVGLADPRGLGRILSARYAELCRGVEVSAATAADLAGDYDAAYGFRVFLRHYCVHLAGPDPSPSAAFPADARAARGFNGDIALHYQRWRQALESGTAGEDLLGVRAARKTLLAVAGLVSIRDQTWTTDRARAARRWGEIEPDLAAPLGALLSWATAKRRPSSEEVQLALAGDGVVAAVVDRFASLIGLWRCLSDLRFGADLTSALILGSAASIALLALHPAYLWLPVAILVLAWISYRNALTAAARFAEAQLVLFDLHRFVLYDTLQRPRPANPEEEREFGSRLTVELWRGDFTNEPYAPPQP